MASCSAIPYGFAHTKTFERARYLALPRSGDCFDANMTLGHELQTDFEWWRRAIVNPRNSIKPLKFSIEIFSDALMSGWEVVCRRKKAHGFWSREERQSYINILELKAAFFGLKCFAEQLKNSDILLRSDNTTAITYINRMGGTRSRNLSSAARRLWDWCEARNNRIEASFIGTKENTEADLESRRFFTETEYSLADWAFQNIALSLGNPRIDLFASRINTKCARFVSWFRDPESSAIDAFTIQWGAFSLAYAFSHFRLS